MSMKAINPVNEELIQEYATLSVAEATAIVDDVHEAYLGWRETDMAARGDLLRQCATVLRERKEVYGKLMTEEMGKTFVSAKAEVEKCAWLCEYYADMAPAFLASKEVETEASRSLITYQPLGVVMAIMPWNFPMWQVFRFAVPALMAGNGAVLKHASNVPGSALAIEEVFRDGGLPANIFRTLLVRQDGVAPLIENFKIRNVSLTGSTPAGRKVSSLAGQHLKRCVLELGGSDPYVILEDADLDMAVETCVTSRLINNGQSCIAAKRFIVVDGVYDAFVEKFVSLMATKKLGDPMDPSTDIGPMARVDLRDEIHDQVERSVAAGASLKLGGVIPDQKGAWYPATVLADVEKGCPAYEEELFGPVATIVRAKDEADAIFIANDTVFGLGSAVFTQDLARGERIATSGIEAGCCFVNSFVKSDPRLPFGGIKDSGYGRELSFNGIHELVNIKTVYIK